MPYTAPTWVPALTDVGSILRARTRNDDGTELGTFTTGTRPTATEVNDFIQDAVIELQLVIPARITDERLTLFARRLAARRAAMAVEISLEPETTTDGTSAYAQLKGLYDEQRAALIDALDDSNSGNTLRVGSLPIRSPFAVDDPADTFPTS